VARPHKRYSVRKSPECRDAERGSKLPQVFLVGDSSEDEELLYSLFRRKKIRVFATGIGPSRKLLEKPGGVALVKRLHDRGLVVHAYTLRADRVRSEYASHEAEIEAFLTRYAVDGVFTDYPDRSAKWLSRKRAISTAKDREQ